jgi:hypothetical protein
MAAQPEKEIFSTYADAMKYLQNAGFRPVAYSWKDVRMERYSQTGWIVKSAALNGPYQVLITK